MRPNQDFSDPSWVTRSDPSRVTRSARAPFPTLEVTESEILNRSWVGGWQSHSLTMTSVPRFSPFERPMSRPVGLPYDEQFVSRKVRMTHRAPQILKEVGRIHTANIQRSLAHRIQIAKEQGDETLLRALNSELREVLL